ncbi:hypothetical protein FQN54_009459 [Arachnomyces sp. PD_36]|nr:hypothetical protein FQN54_009459 [Arachnomyces sp. PD_36]
MNPGPLPAKRAFLHDLHNFPPGSKARFLGCVTNYDVQTGTLTLEHHYPHTTPKPATIPVDITLLLESIKSSDLQVGAWLNVLGYVREKEKDKNNRTTSHRASNASRESIYIEAVMVFPAGSFHIGEYERVLQDWIDVDRMVRGPG